MTAASKGRDVCKPGLKPRACPWLPLVVAVKHPPTQCVLVYIGS